MNRLRSRHVPFRVLAYAQYGIHDCISRHVDAEQTHVTIRTGDLRRILRTTVQTLGSTFEWLQRCRYIVGLERSMGHASFRIPHARNWNWNAPVPSAASTEEALA